MIVTPSIKRLEAAFPGKGKVIKALLTGITPTRSFPSVQALLKQCYSEPDTHYRRMTALNEILEGCGIEAIREEESGTLRADYINMGDAYRTTLLFDFNRGRYLLTTWGDFVEAHNL